MKFLFSTLMVLVTIFLLTTACTKADEVTTIDKVATIDPTEVVVGENAVLLKSRSTEVISDLDTGYLQPAQFDLTEKITAWTTSMTFNEKQNVLFLNFRNEKGGDLEVGEYPGESVTTIGVPDIDVINEWQEAGANPDEFPQDAFTLVDYDASDVKVSISKIVKGTGDGLTLPKDGMPGIQILDLSSLGEDDFDRTEMSFHGKIVSADGNSMIINANLLVLNPIIN